MEKRLKQWSTFRGLALMGAAAAGVHGEVVQGLASLLDLLPQITISAIGLYDMLRDDKRV